MRYVAAAFFGQFVQMDGQRVVWRVRPELSEDHLLHYFSPDGTQQDPVTYEGGDLREVDIGERRAILYARFWLEPEKET